LTSVNERLLALATSGRCSYCEGLAASDAETGLHVVYHAEDGFALIGADTG
jgi:hypothetical protein